jgi:serine/threonine-protein kinase
MLDIPSVARSIELHSPAATGLDGCYADRMRPEARVGILFNEWRLEALLGAGSIAATYAARRFGEHAAIRILHERFARSKSIRDQFVALADVPRTIAHTAIPRIISAGVARDNETFLIMELLEGETLDAAWRGHELHRLSGGARSRAPIQPTMPVGRALAIFARVLDGLVACHAQNVLHRGLTPGAVFLTEHDAIKLLNVGVAALRDRTTERTATATPLGGTAYMSPEQAMGLVSQLDGRADLFSVGAMMHAVLTGHPIRSATTEAESLVMAATTPVPSVSRIAPHLPKSVAEIIDKSLKWDRRTRYSTAREMHDAVIKLLN